MYSAKSNSFCYNSEKITTTLQDFCLNYHTNNVSFDYKLFKFLYNHISIEKILQHIINVINSILNKYDTFIVHVNIKSLTLLDIDKYKEFIQIMSIKLKELFNDKLEKCYIYDAPYIFSSVFNFLNMFIDKKTQDKLEIVCKTNKL